MAKPAARLPYTDVRPFFDAVVNANPDRLLWATDWPHSAIHVASPDDAELVDMTLDWLGPDETLREKAFVQNPMTLYGFT